MPDPIHALRPPDPAPIHAFLEDPRLDLAATFAAALTCLLPAEHDDGPPAAPRRGRSSPSSAPATGPATPCLPPMAAPSNDQICACCLIRETLAASEHPPPTPSRSRLIGYRPWSPPTPRAGLRARVANKLASAFHHSLLTRKSIIQGLSLKGYKR